MSRESLPALGVSVAVSRIRLESQAIEGDSPVGEADHMSTVTFLSMSEHVKFGLNPAGPPAKAKYESMTDSALVP